MQLYMQFGFEKRIHFYVNFSSYKVYYKKWYKRLYIGEL